MAKLLHHGVRVRIRLSTYTKVGILIKIATYLGALGSTQRAILPRYHVDWRSVTDVVTYLTVHTVPQLSTHTRR